MNPFALLGLELHYDLDLKAAEQKYLALARALHPDRYAQSSPSHRKAALEHAMKVNEAWQIVRDPIRRAEALFEVFGVLIDEEKEPEPEVLMEMMEWREGLTTIQAQGDMGGLRLLSCQVKEEKARLEGEIAAGFASAQGQSEKLKAFVPKLGQSRYIRRIAEDIELFEKNLSSSKINYGSARNF